VPRHFSMFDLAEWLNGYAANTPKA
jgi:hypothetical protein